MKTGMAQFELSKYKNAGGEVNRVSRGYFFVHCQLLFPATDSLQQRIKSNPVGNRKIKCSIQSAPKDIRVYTVERNMDYFC